MALTEFQRGVCRLLAENRVRSGESYVAGGAALNEQALAASWSADHDRLDSNGYAVTVVRERPTFVEAEVRRDGEAVIVQWAHDSAYRFFPLIRHDELGLVLHPFDLATSKVLALVGRVEPRDFVDTLSWPPRLPRRPHRRRVPASAFQPLTGVPGWVPGAGLRSRTSRYERPGRARLSEALNQD